MSTAKSTRIGILLGIDTAFFLLELIVGYAVHSLALVADSFHMLNDVLSLCVGLWAVKAATQKTSSKMYTYGWQRAETLGALVNGVFLVALCLSIFLEAIQRIVEPQEVSNPKLVLIVGCFGLASNILGLFLFHEHGHSHGGEEHSHSHYDQVKSAEEGRNRQGCHGDPESEVVADQSGNIADVLPQSRIGNWPSSNNQKLQFKEPSVDGPSEDRTRSPAFRREYSYKRHHSRSRSRAYSGLGDIPIHPASFRNEIIAASHLEDIESSSIDTEAEQGDVENQDVATETTSLLKRSKSNSSHINKSHRHAIISPNSPDQPSHEDHKHNKPKEAGKGEHGHSHGDLNMRGVFLHVMGDALGNIGVIGSALVIWLTDYSWRFYADPVISLVITVIILCSAIPLCKAASRILLQAVPAGISIDDIQEDIEDLDGIISCHHLHVWQLSDLKFVASLHVQVDFDFKNEGSARYMTLARAVRKCLHEYGIHSSTIQPEFCLDPDHPHAVASRKPHDHEHDSEDSEHGASSNGSSRRGKSVSKQNSRTGSLRSELGACLLECGDECATAKQCCAPRSSEGSADDGHGHNH
ncbi:cation efflux protein [Patellaria atrata CBS 101060]|uniref:Cation efflux protein n=1 Tax=Patellaria atrata CBS 101060 TaxID=1346257 RepID=A0A9P4VQJ7_9PEZI|nr:cation efflux protein [Patellaria atrata CBS 101060]